MPLIGPENSCAVLFIPAGAWANESVSSIWHFKSVIMLLPHIGFSLANIVQIDTGVANAKANKVVEETAEANTCV